jgi:hypothetical protein
MIFLQSPASMSSLFPRAMLHRVSGRRPIRTTSTQQRNRFLLAIPIYSSYYSFPSPSLTSPLTHPISLVRANEDLHE